MNTKRAFALAQEMLNDHGLKKWRVVHRRFKSTGGMTYFDEKEIGFSPRLIEKWTEAQFRQIVLHEIAHALVGHPHGHGKVWAAKARSIGYRGGTSHNFPIIEPRWIVDCPDCGELYRRHNRFSYKLFCTQCENQVRLVEVQNSALKTDINTC